MLRMHAGILPHLYREQKTARIPTREILDRWDATALGLTKSNEQKSKDWLRERIAPDEAFAAQQREHA